MVCGDTMNYWIHDHRENLDKVLVGLDALLINDGEAKMLAGDENLLRAAEKVLATGPKVSGDQARRIRSDGVLQRSVL